MKYRVKPAFRSQVGHRYLRVLPERQERQAEFLSKEKSVTRLLTRSGNALHWLYRSNETREQSEKAPVTQAKPPASRG